MHSPTSFIPSHSHTTLSLSLSLSHSHSHDIRKGRCRECEGTAICPHGNMNASCRECGGSSFCIHSKWIHYCVACTAERREQAREENRSADHIVVSSFANLDGEGRVRENAPYVSCDAHLSSFIETLMPLSPRSYRQLNRSEFSALFYTHPCTAWRIGLVILVLWNFSHDELVLKEMHNLCMAKWTWKAFKGRVCHPREDSLWRTIFELVAGFPSVTESVDELLERAYFEYDKILMWCLHDHKVCVKIIEMYHWCYNQPCGYGSNRQHQMWLWLNMAAGNAKAAARQKRGHW